MFLLISKLIIALLLLGSSAFARGRSFLFFKRFWLLPAAAFLVFSVLLYYSFLHYQFWNANEFTKTLSANSDFIAELESLNLKFVSGFLVPVFTYLNDFIKFLFPSYSGGEYLLFFLLTRLWGEYLISLTFSSLFLWTTLKLNKKYDERFFYGEEPYFGAIAIFLTGWPGWLYYLIALLAIFLVFNLASTARERKRDNTAASDVNEARLSLYYFWLPIAIIIIASTYYLKGDLPFYYLLKI